LAKSPYDTDLDRNPANFQPLTPLSFLERAATVFPDQAARRRHRLCGAPSPAWRSHYTQKEYAKRERANNGGGGRRESLH
jgi:hypothetical protein